MRTKPIEKIAWGVSLLLNIAWAVLVFSSLNTQQLYVYFNSDTLYLPSIFRDVFLDGSGIRGWHLNAAPNFFPDMGLYFVFNALVRDFKLAMMLYSLFQYLLLLLLLNATLKTAMPAMRLPHLSAANLLMLLFFFVTTFSGDFVFTFYLFSISYHLGPFMMTLACLLLLIKFLRTRKPPCLYWLGFLVLLAALSNRLFLVMFVLPSMALLPFALKRTYRRDILLSLGLIVAASLSGLILFNLVKSAGVIHVIGTDWKVFNFSNIGASWRVMSEQHRTYLRMMDFRGVLVLLSVLSFLTTGVIAIKEAYKVLKGRTKEREDWLTAFYACFSAAFFLIVLFMPVINGSYVGWAILRYNVQVFYLALFNYAFLLNYLLRKVKGDDKLSVRVVQGVLAAALAFTLFYGTSRPVRQGLASFLDYYPDYVERVDAFSRESGLTYGVAEYWYAKKTTMFSRNGVRLYTVHPDMAIWYHVMNRNWYYKGGRGRHAEPEFRFVVATRLQEEAIQANLGEPLQSFEHLGYLNILVFPEFCFDPKTRRPFLCGP